MSKRKKRLSPAEWAELIQRTGSDIEKYLVARGICKRYEVDDIIHEAYLRADHYYPSFDPSQGPIDAWFKQICRNVAYDQYRERVLALGQNLSADALAQYCRLPSEPLNDDTMWSLAKRAVYEILKIYSDVDQIILYKWASSIHADWTGSLADQLNMTPGALRTRRHRLLERLRKDLEMRGFHVDLPMSEPVGNHRHSAASDADEEESSCGDGDNLPEANL